MFIILKKISFYFATGILFFVVCSSRCCAADDDFSGAIWGMKTNDVKSIMHNKTLLLDIANTLLYKSNSYPETDILFMFSKNGLYIINYTFRTLPSNHKSIYELLINYMTEKYQSCDCQLENHIRHFNNSRTSITIDQNENEISVYYLSTLQ